MKTSQCYNVSVIQDKVKKTIQKFKMLQGGDTVLIGVSGGCDSMVLFHLLHELGKSLKLKFAIAHINHGLRGKNSDRDETFVRKLAQKFKVPIFVSKAAVKEKKKEENISLEEAARFARYDFFEKVAEQYGAQKVALAHTLDDQAETVLMRIIQGTGLQGLQAIRPKRKLNGAYLIRPLIEVSRDEVRQFAKQKNICFREDESNQSLRFVRNRIRLKLIPFIQRMFNPQVKKALARLPYLLDVDLSYLEQTAEIFFDDLAEHKRKGEIFLPKKSFLELGPSIQYRLMNRALKSISGAELYFDHWNNFLGLLLTEKRFRFQLPKNVIVYVDSKGILMKQNGSEQFSFEYSLRLGDSLYIPEIDKTIKCEVIDGHPKLVHKSNKSFEWVDLEKLSFPLLVRNRTAGDRFRPLGQAQALKLKGFLINQHVAVSERNHLPIVLSDKKIVWVGGIAIGDESKVTQKTRQIARLSLEPGNRI